MPRTYKSIFTPETRSAAISRVTLAAGIGADHRGWYTDAQNHVRHVATERGLPLLLVAAVYAAVSPRSRPARNRLLAGKALDYYQTSNLQGLHTDRWGGLPSHKVAVARVFLAYDGGGCPIGALNGPKTSSFARNLAGDMAPVTIDVWACRSLGVEHASVQRWRQYQEGASVFVEVAAALGWAPAEVQAAAWAGEQTLAKSEGGRSGGEPGRNF